jgi:hypothetical protein
MGKTIKYIFQFINSIFTKVDSTDESSFKFGNEFWASNTQLLIFANGVISTKIFENGVLDTSGWKREFTTDWGFIGRFIQGENNIFAVGSHNLLYHFNGSD